MFGSLIVLGLAFSLAASFAQAQRVPVVVELFTSEGCSSCPPADALLARLDAAVSDRRIGIPGNVDVIALGEHVDYWDELGWKDRFSSPLFSARQQDYGIASGVSSVYTPQAVVNGSKEVLGSDSGALSRAIRDASNAPRAIVEIHSSTQGHDAISLKVGKLPAGSHQVDVFLAIAESEIETNVAAGENSGHKLHHAAVVRSISRLAILDPSKPGEYTADARLNLKDDWKRANTKVVILVQDRQTKKIVGAASMKL
jgi:hypothetical protein